MIAARLAGALLVLLAAGAASADPLDEPAFTASPAALLAAAAQAPGTDDVVVLREDVAFTIGADGGIDTPAPLRSLGPTGWDFAQKRLKALGVTP